MLEVQSATVLFGDVQKHLTDEHTTREVVIASMPTEI